MIALVVFALAVGALLLQDGSLPHRHDRPGIYNHDHDLTLPAARSGGAPLPDGTPAISFLPAIAANWGLSLRVPRHRRSATPLPARHPSPADPPPR